MNEAHKTQMQYLKESTKYWGRTTSVWLEKQGDQFSKTIDWNKIKNRNQQLIWKSNEQENFRHISHNYNKDDLVTMIKMGQIVSTLYIKQENPFRVIKQLQNGSITIETAPYEQKNVNKQQLHPYYWQNNNEPQGNDNEQYENKK